MGIVIVLIMGIIIVAGLTAFWSIDGEDIRIRPMPDSLKHLSQEPKTYRELSEQLKYHRDKSIKPTWK